MVTHTEVSRGKGAPESARPGRPRSKPDRLVLDRGYDSNGLRARLAERGIEPIIPAQKNHPNATHQGCRKLDAIAVAGSSSGRLPGSDGVDGCWFDMSGSSASMPRFFT